MILLVYVLKTKKQHIEGMFLLYCFRELHQNGYNLYFNTIIINYVFEKFALNRKISTRIIINNNIFM